MPSWWLADAWEDGPTRAIAWVAWIIVSITLHELGHGWMAIRCGDDVPLRTGHMTLNPFVHIPFPWAWIMFLALGITWGQMPVQPANFRGRYDDAKVAFAGPMVNLLLAIGCIIFDIAWLTYGPIGNEGLHTSVHTAVFVGLELNLVLFLFNLLPVPPLDGSRILGNFVPAFGRLWQGQAGAIVGLLGFIFMFRYAGAVIWPTAWFVAVGCVKSGLVLSGGEWVHP